MPPSSRKEGKSVDRRPKRQGQGRRESDSRERPQIQPPPAPNAPRYSPAAIAGPSNATEARFPQEYDLLPVNMQSMSLNPAPESSGSPSAGTSESPGIIVNDGSAVRTRAQVVTPYNITSPDSRPQNFSAQLEVPSSGRPKERNETTFDESFKVRHRPFFVVGRVMMMLWAEPAGANSLLTAALVKGKFGESVHHKVRRFVVVREDRNSCTVIPISTYGGKGTTKPKIVKSAHSVIYTGKQPPALLQGEYGMQPVQIRVDPDNKHESLDPRSRLNYGETHTIHHNYKVRPFGMVAPGSMTDLIDQLRKVYISKMGLKGARTLSSSDQSGAAPLSSSSEYDPPTSSARQAKVREHTQAVASSSKAGVSPNDIPSETTFAKIPQVKDAIEKLMEKEKLSWPAARSSLYDQFIAKRKDAASKKLDEIGSDQKTTSPPPRAPLAAPAGSSTSTALSSAQRGKLDAAVKEVMKKTGQSYEATAAHLLARAQKQKQSAVDSSASEDEEEEEEEEDEDEGEDEEDEDEDDN